MTLQLTNQGAYSVVIKFQELLQMFKNPLVLLLFQNIVTIWLF